MPAATSAISCGSLLDATLLIDPRSKIDGSTPELRETEHFYLDLGALATGMVEFLRQREQLLPPNVLRQSLGQIQADSLHGRAITATWIGASPCRWKAGMASACTCGSRQ
jgi:methionyl-tRNA synthetase